MLLKIPQVLDRATLAHCRARLQTAHWVDGNVTSGHQSARAKRNEQIDEHDPLAQELGGLILQALSRHPAFIGAALPQHVYPPLFNRYGEGQGFGTHVDNAIRQHRSSGLRLRSDWSVTLFLAEPDEYDGGELLIEDSYGEHRVKLPAGDLVLYPASSLHRVTPVTRGQRLASFFWVQSLVADESARRTLYELDQAIQQLGAEAPDHRAVLQLTGIYHNLLRRWSTL